MWKCVVQVLSTVLLIGMTTVIPAHADPVTVTSGTVVARMSGGSFSLAGDGFHLTGGAADGYAGEIFQCEPCAASDRLPFTLGSSTGGHFSTGFPGAFAGVEYPTTNLFGHFTFTTETRNSQVLAGPTLTSPFTFQGELLNFGPGGEGFPIFLAELSGSGIATAHFTGPIGDNRVFFADDVTYQFVAATPEPASLLLLGTGAAIILVRRATSSANQR